MIKTLPPRLEIYCKPNIKHTTFKTNNIEQQHPGSIKRRKTLSNEEIFLKCQISSVYRHGARLNHCKDRL